MRELHAPRAPRQKFASSLAILFLPSHSSSRFTKESNFSIFCDQRPSQKKGKKKGKLRIKPDHLPESYCRRAPSYEGLSRSRTRKCFGSGFGRNTPSAGTEDN